MTVETNQVGDVIVMKLSGELNGRGELAPLFWAYLHRGNYKFILNCERLRAINSVGLSMLLEFKRLAEASGGAMVLHGLAVDVRQLLKTTRLDEVFTISDDEEVALSALIPGLPVINAGSTMSRYRN